MSTKRITVIIGNPSPCHFDSLDELKRHNKEHRVSAMRRTMNGDHSKYGHKCTCGTFWKIYQNEVHNHE